MVKRILILLVVLLAVALGVNAVVASNETESAQAEAGSRVVELPGGDLNVRESGPELAPAIVLLHCYTCALDYWAELEPLLDDQRRVISIDLLGHGGSEKPKDGYDMANQADLVAGVLRRLGEREALVAGQSLGGEIAAAVAERHPKLVRGVVVMDSPPTAEFGNLPFLARLARWPVIGQATERLATDSAIRDNLERAFAEGFDVPDAFVEDVRDMTYTAFDEIPSEVDDYTSERSLDDRLADTGKPLLVIFGAEDRIVDPEAADEFRDVPGARVVMLPGVGHTPQVEVPRRTAALVRRFDMTTLVGKRLPRRR